MDNQIEQVIAELSKIDEAATKIISNSESEKEAYAGKIKKQMEQFDAQLNEKNQQELKEFESDLYDKHQAELAECLESTAKSIDDINLWYTKNHATLARQIVNDLTKE